MDRAAYEKARTDKMMAGCALCGLVRALLRLDAISEAHRDMARKLVAEHDAAYAAERAAIATKGDA